MDVTFVEDPMVELIDAMGSDLSIARAARVSTKGANDPEGTEVKGLINYLVKNQHNSPLEHNSMTFFIEAPIFVFREFHRHRVGWSYNESSGRYRKLEPRFWVPGYSRPLENVGTSARPQMAPTDQYTATIAQGEIRAASSKAWAKYESLLELGVANEVARAVLPVNTMSQMYATCNLRSLFHFLSLRTSNPEARNPSHPQWEIEQVAVRMEAFAAQRFPLAHGAFVANGRVAP